MYKLMIVEDEPLEREAVALLVKKHFPLLAKIQMAENGFEALESVENFNPDIILMDINMPGMDGLETIRRMREKKVPAKFIIITSYNQFEYAQQAIRLGVEDFLIKPADIPTIRRTLEKVIEKIDTESSSEDTKRQLEEQLTDLQPILEGDLVQLIASGVDKNGLAARFSSLDLYPENPFVIITKSEGDSPIILNRLQAMLNAIEINFLADLVHGLIVIILLKIPEKWNHREMTEKISKYMENNLSCPCTIGVGRPVSSAEELNISYMEAQNALKDALQNENRIFFHKEKKHSVSRISINSYADLLLEKILEQDGNFRNLTDHLFSEIFFSGEDITQNKEQILFQILILIRQKLSDRLPYLSLEETFFSLEDFIHSQENRNLQKNIFEKYLNEMEEIVSRTGESRQNIIVQKAIDYIRENYHQNIGMEDLAEYLNLSTFHISKVIKKSTGRSFPEILNRYRMNEAIRLIEEGQLSIKEISYKVGCNSQHYFSRIFKKYTGNTPTEFRNQH